MVELEPIHAKYIDIALSIIHFFSCHPNNSNMKMSTKLQVNPLQVDIDTSDRIP